MINLMITQMMIRYLLGNGFRSKRALADEFGISYRKLLSVYGARADQKTATVVARGLVHGCIVNHISIENAIDIS